MMILQIVYNVSYKRDERVEAACRARERLDKAVRAQVGRGRQDGIQAGVRVFVSGEEQAHR